MWTSSTEALGSPRSESHAGPACPGLFPGAGNGRKPVSPRPRVGAGTPWPESLCTAPAQGLEGSPGRPAKDSAPNSAARRPRPGERGQGGASCLRRPESAPGAHRGSHRCRGLPETSDLAGGGVSARLGLAGLGEPRRAAGGLACPPCPPGGGRRGLNLGRGIGSQGGTGTQGPEWAQPPRGSRTQPHGPRQAGRAGMRCEGIC